MRHLFPDIFASFLPKCGRPSAAEPPALAGGLIAWSTVPACWSPWPQLPCGRPPASIFRQARPGHICSALLLHVFQITAVGICCYGSPHRGTLCCASLLLVHKKVTAESLHSDSLFFPHMVSISPPSAQCSWPFLSVLSKRSVRCLSRRPVSRRRGNSSPALYALWIQIRSAAAPSPVPAGPAADCIPHVQTFPPQFPHRRPKSAEEL